MPAAGRNLGSWPVGGSQLSLRDGADVSAIWRTCCIIFSTQLQHLSHSLHEGIPQFVENNVRSRQTTHASCFPFTTPITGLGGEMHRDSSPTRYGKEAIIRCQSAPLSLLAPAGMDARLRKVPTHGHVPRMRPGSDLLALSSDLPMSKTHLCATNQWRQRLVVEHSGTERRALYLCRATGGMYWYNDPSGPEVRPTVALAARPRQLSSAS
jgi:hypothetical protein